MKKSFNKTSPQMMIFNSKPSLHQKRPLKKIILTTQSKSLKLPTNPKVSLFRKTITSPPTIKINQSKLKKKANQWCLPNLPQVIKKVIKLSIIARTCTKSSRSQLVSQWKGVCHVKASARTEKKVWRGAGSHKRTNPNTFPTSTPTWSRKAFLTTRKSWAPWARFKLIKSIKECEPW